jgi:hypothetical protein
VLYFELHEYSFLYIAIMSDNADNRRAITRSISKGILSNSQGLDQPYTEAETIFINENLKQSTQNPISEMNLLLQVQKLIQEGQQEVKNSIDNMQHTTDMNRQILQAHLEDIDQRLTKTEITTHDRLEKIQQLITHPKVNRMVYSKRLHEEANDPLGPNNTSAVADAGKDTEEDPLGLDPNYMKLKGEVAEYKDTTNGYSKSEVEGEYSEEGEVQSDAMKGSNRHLKETSLRRAKQETARMRVSTRFKAKAHSKYRKDPNQNSSSSSSSNSDNERRRSSSFKHSRKSKKKEDSDSDYSTDDNIEFVPIKFRNLKNNRINNPELKEILSYQTYRLADQTQSISNNLRKELGKIAIRMKAHIPDDQKFTGHDPVAVIRFLEEFKNACDDNGLSEGAALYIFQYFLVDPAKKSLRLFLRTNASNRDQHSYCGVVLFLLTSYAPEEEVHSERRKIFLHQQKTTESEVDFAVRLQDQASRLGRAFQEGELITSYMNGLPEHIRTYISSVHPNATTFITTQMAAQKAGRTLKKSPPVYSISTLPPVRRPTRLTAPNFVYQPSKESPITNLRPRQTPSCFVCSKDHYLHECPTLSEDQRKHALSAHERFTQLRQQRDMLRNYKGNTYNGGERPNYMMARETAEEETLESQEVSTEESSENA